MVQQTILRWTVQGGGSGLNVLNWSDGSTAAEINSCVQNALLAMQSTISSLASAALDPTLEQRDTVTGTLIGESSITSPANITGGGTAALVPNLAQGLLRFTTGTIVGGRRLRGRMFIPGLAATAVAADGNVASSALSDLQAAGNALSLADHLHVWHRPVNGAGGASGAVNGVTPWTEFASQRRRRQ